jgi:hypothetical protein
MSDGDTRLDSVSKIVHNATIETVMQHGSPSRFSRIVRRAPDGTEEEVGLALAEPDKGGTQWRKLDRPLVVTFGDIVGFR